MTEPLKPEEKAVIVRPTSNLFSKTVWYSILSNVVLFILYLTTWEPVASHKEVVAILLGLNGLLGIIIRQLTSTPTQLAVKMGLVEPKKSSSNY